MRDGLILWVVCGECGGGHGAQWRPWAVWSHLNSLRLYTARERHVMRFTMTKNIKSLINDI